MSDASNKHLKEKLAKLKVQQLFLAKSCKASVHSLKLCNPSLHADITALDEKLENQRNQDKEDLYSRMLEINETFFELKNNLSDTENLKSFDAAKCRDKLINLQNKISIFREDIEKQKFYLLEEEKRLQEEVAIAQHRLEEGRQSYRFSESTTSSKIHKGRTNYTKHQDIAKFEKFIEEKGVTGGWEENDHLLFLRLRRQHHRKKEAFFTALQTQMPDVSLEEIEKHNEWFQEYTLLKEKHKQAIEIWKTNKKETRAINSNNEESKTRKSSLLSEMEESNKKKSEIAEWKRQRQLQQEALAQEQKAKEEAEAAKIKSESERKALLRAAVLRHRQEKQKEYLEIKQTEALRQKEEREEKAAQARKLIKTFRKMDQLFVEKQRLLRIRTTASVTQLPKVEVPVEVKRDPTRVQQHTKVWQAHCKTKANPFKPIIHLRNMPHLAVPSWRKGLI